MGSRHGTAASQGMVRPGRPPKRLRRDAEHLPISVKELALGLPNRSWRTIAWRQGSAEPLSSRFARVRVHAARRDFTRSESWPEEWLLIEWPKDEPEPTKYWLSTLPEDIAFQRLVDLTKLRWRIERDYQELKQEVGLGHFEGRGWRGFHHHATLCIAAYGFLVSERETIPPQALVPPGRSRHLPFPTVTDPEAPPLRTQRHVPNSIATTRQRLIVALAKRLPRCPCCAAPTQRNLRRICDTVELVLRTERNSSDGAVLDQAYSPFRRTVGEMSHVDVAAERRNSPK